MAEKKEGGGGIAFTFIEIIIGVGILIYVIMTFYRRGKEVVGQTAIGSSISFESVSLFVHSLYEYFIAILPTLRLIAFAISGLAFVGIIHSVRGIRKIRAIERSMINPDTSKKSAGTTTRASNPKWERVRGHISSENPNDWKFAILEADIMLDELLDSLGYRGESIGDKLKQVEKSDFTTIDNAWEAHKVRNAIAHEGADFMINEREAKRVIGLFQTVFEEFKYI